MAKSKGTRILITLECKFLNKRSEGVSRYSTQRTVGTTLNESN
jgi:hypothetical protein